MEGAVSTQEAVENRRSVAAQPSTRCVCLRPPRALVCLCVSVCVCNPCARGRPPGRSGRACDPPIDSSKQLFCVPLLAKPNRRRKRRHTKTRLKGLIPRAPAPPTLPHCLPAPTPPTQARGPARASHHARTQPSTVARAPIKRLWTRPSQRGTRARAPSPHARTRRQAVAGAFVRLPPSPPPSSPPPCLVASLPPDRPTVRRRCLNLQFTCERSAGVVAIGNAQQPPSRLTPLARLNSAGRILSAEESDPIGSQYASLTP